MNIEVIKAFADLDAKLEKIEKDEKMKELEESAKEVYKVYESFVKAGFTPDMAEQMILIMFEKGLNGDNNE